jgi:hypothetical protein
MPTGPGPPVLLVTWHFLAIRFGRAPRSERPVRVGPILTRSGHLNRREPTAKNAGM